MTDKAGKVDIVFDGPPGPYGPRFIEVEIEGKSVRLGKWVQRPDGLWALRVTSEDIDNAQAQLEGSV